MSKLSPALKALINAPFARPSYTPAPAHIRSVFENIKHEATSKDVGTNAWVVLSTAASMTMNSPESLAELHKFASKPSDNAHAVQTAELIREAGLKCISFNGIPRTINCLGEFRTNLPSEVYDNMRKTATRHITVENLPEATKRGRALWDSVYAGFETKLLDKLAQSHPDLPVYILNSNYTTLLSDPPGQQVPGAKVGRVLTSILGISCLRAQTGVGPQVVSHCFGLRKALKDGTYRAPGEEEVPGFEWLASDEGNQWILRSVDSIVDAIGGGEGTTFAPGLRARL
ncbi:hypothetical protein F5884DRAFT_781555 [Xylogone sp. PMI_703]|nr:hypothetical protein F5884DRAFT_781555 [Xylogone sp. PMI_703]